MRSCTIRSPRCQRQGSSPAATWWRVVLGIIGIPGKIHLGQNVGRGKSSNSAMAEILWEDNNSVMTASSSTFQTRRRIRCQFFRGIFTRLNVAEVPRGHNTLGMSNFTWRMRLATSVPWAPSWVCISSKTRNWRRSGWGSFPSQSLAKRCCINP